MKFRFAEEEDACEYVTRLAGELHLYPPAHALKVTLMLSPNSFHVRRKQPCMSCPVSELHLWAYAHASKVLSA